MSLIDRLIRQPTRHWLLLLALLYLLLRIPGIPGAHDLYGLLLSLLVCSLAWLARTAHSQWLAYRSGLLLYLLAGILDWLDGALPISHPLGKLADTLDDPLFAVAFFLIGLAYVRVNQDREALIASLHEEIARRQTLEQTLHDWAFRDELTGLGNRRALFEAFSQAARAGETGILLYIDVNQFKQVNDRLGHETGDKVLQACAAALSDLPGAVFRLGGDEFAALLTGADDAEASRQEQRLKLRVQPLESEFGVSLSIGRAHYSPDELRQADLLLASADHAMYNAKRATRRPAPP
ncbi:GGDEF domain-containing protein [Chitinilyticum piscinae]|uniref:diguanylate cyclase n=1 Tax=Chitinilyticum piscinae TaxID=2866724 RepID=A0A8J7FGS3_9NEIS|nr:GGDEF domain-containing protein [Chitinilyticum piscinae]MBE9608875.1 GGDEF domain-containing protein [Chitinilyticum piscinae]